MEFMNSRNLTHHNINGLFPEIMDEIFSFVDEGKSDDDDDGKPLPWTEEYFCAPILLSGVCRYWRAIALGQPKLWTNLYINLCPSLCRKPDQLAVTEDWLERSGSLPLNLTLYYHNLRIDFECTTSLFNLLRKHSARWGRLNVRFAPRGTLYRLFHDLKELPPSQAFYLQIGKCFDTDRLDPPLQPSHLYSKGGVDITSGSVLPFGWKNLTHLELCYWTAKDVLSLIGQAPELKRCVLRKLRSVSRESYWNAAPISAIQHVVHKGLYELKFGGTALDFFPNITLPSLRHLHITSAPMRDNPGQWTWDDLSAFLGRCEIDPKSLDTFSLDYSHQKWPDSLNFQELTAAVTHLNVQSRDILDSLLLDVNFPRLREVKFHFVSLWDLTQDPRMTPVLEPKACETLDDYLEKYKITLRQRQFRPSFESIVLLY